MMNNEVVFIDGPLKGTSSLVSPNALKSRVVKANTPPAKGERDAILYEYYIHQFRDANGKEFNIAARRDCSDPLAKLLFDYLQVSTLVEAGIVLKLKNRISQLLRALRFYGRHDVNCGSFSSGCCSCGLVAALETDQTTPPEPAVTPPDDSAKPPENLYCEVSKLIDNPPKTHSLTDLVPGCKYRFTFRYPSAKHPDMPIAEQYTAILRGFALMNDRAMLHTSWCSGSYTPTEHLVKAEAVE